MTSKNYAFPSYYLILPNHNLIYSSNGIFRNVSLQTFAFLRPLLWGAGTVIFTIVELYMHELVFFQRLVSGEVDKKAFTDMVSILTNTTPLTNLLLNHPVFGRIFYKHKLVKVTDKNGMRSYLNTSA